jgi:OmpA-OmpF porin, OOP family
MKKIASTLTAVSALAVLGACQGSHPPGYTNVFGKWAMQPEAAATMRDARGYSGSAQGGAYNQALYTETMEHAEFEFARMEDYRSSNFHARNAITAAEGSTYEPTQLGEWRLPADQVDELGTARERLVAALASGGADRNPQQAARALAKFNCWVEQTEENFQPADIAYCRDEFYAALEQIEEIRTGFPEVVALDADVFFDFDRANIRSDAQPILNDVARLLVEDTSTQVLVWGHTDRAGSESYNQGLSERRADAVAAYLAQQGVTSDRMVVQGFGETRPAVETADGVPEQRNRRVEIRRR